MLKNLVWLGTARKDVREIRIQTGAGHRVIYVAKHEEAVYVLHAFEKKTQKTSRADLALAKERFEEMQRSRPKGKRARKKKE